MAPYLNLIVPLLVVGRHAVASFSIPPPRFARNSGVLESNQFSFSSRRPPPFTTASPAGAASSRCASTTTALGAIPDWAPYVLGHNVGGLSGAPIVARARKWYGRIPLPSWTPPSFLFGPVWALLYAAMGASAWRITKSGSALTGLATRSWYFHYALNLIWAPVFFGFQKLRLALVINFFLIATLGYILPLFHRIDPLSAYLQIPYLLWVLFATRLNQAICKLNPMVGDVNEAMVQADLCASGDGYNDAMLQYDIKKLQAAAAKYAGV